MGEAAKQFRKVNGYLHLPALRAALTTRREALRHRHEFKSPLRDVRIGWTLLGRYEPAPGVVVAATPLGACWPMNPNR